MKPIRDKRLSIELYGDGIFGNWLRHWDTGDDWLDSPADDGLFVIRTQKRRGGGTTLYDLGPEEVTATLRVLKETDCNLSDYYVHDSIDNSHLIVQGHLWDAPDGFVFDHSFLPIPMNDAIRQDPRVLHTVGLPELVTAPLLPRARAALNFVLETWPRHVYELTIMDAPFGQVFNSNVMIWEVRDY